MSVLFVYTITIELTHTQATINYIAYTPRVQCLRKELWVVANKHKVSIVLTNKYNNSVLF